MRKTLRRILAASILAGSFIFNSNIFNIDVAHAEIKKYTGVGESIISDRETLATAKEGAKMQAIRAAQEEAGIFISSHSIMSNGQLPKDELVAFTAGIVKVTDDIRYELISLNDNLGTAKYRAVVVVIIDTDDLNRRIEEWQEQNSQTRAIATEINGAIPKIVEDLKRRNAELEAMLAEVNSNKATIQEKLSNLEQDTLYARKLTEANAIAEIHITKDKKFYVLYKGNSIESPEAKVFNLYNEAIEINPNGAEAYFLRGILREDRAGKLSDFTKAIQLDPNNTTYIWMRVNYFYYDNFPVAIDEYTKIISINPNDFEAYAQRGWAYHNLGAYDKAIADYKKATIPYKDYTAESYYTEEPNYTAHYRWLLSRLYYAYESIGEHSTAQALYDKIMELFGELR